MFYLIIIGAYLVFVAAIVFVCHRLGRGWLTKGVVIAILLLAPFWDIFLAKIIMLNFVRSNAPLQTISQTVEIPESVIWIDNVWPGFDEYGRHWMVVNYLDGVHLKELALNGDDGKIYLYRASLDDFTVSEKLRPEHERLKKIVKGLEDKAKETYRSGGDNKELWRMVREEYEPQLKELGYLSQRKNELDQVFARPVVYQNTDGFPPMNYQVEFQRNRLADWQEKFIWCDEVIIKDNQQNKDIAFSKRCLEYSPMVAPIVVGSSPFEGGRHIGDKQAYEFDDRVLFEYTGLKNQFESVRSGIRRSSYNLTRLRWERKHKKQLGGVTDAK